MKQHSIIRGWLFLVALCFTCEAGYRTAGKYCGVVVFDRWGGCILYSGIYVMYVSESIKNQLRPYRWQAIQIDAKEVSQPHNPGDGLIKRFEYLGPAPAGEETWVRLEGINLASSVRVAGADKPVATLLVANTNRAAVKVWGEKLAFTLLIKRGVHIRGVVSDGPSFAVITRRSLARDGPLWEAEGTVGGLPHTWSVRRENALPSEFTLAPGEVRNIGVYLDLPDGEYELLGGYAGGVHDAKCVASNLSAFDVRDGKAEVVNVKSR
jgi:hypothetical protein